MVLTTAGLLAGAGAGILGGRLLRSLLVGVATADLPTLALVSALVAVVALLALAVPARRAMAIAPIEALRSGDG